MSRLIRFPRHAKGIPRHHDFVFYNQSHSTPTLKTPWQGACLDTGAQRTVIGLRQAKAYCRYTGTKFRLVSSKNRYRFGNDRQSSLGSLTIQIPFLDSHATIERVDVVNSDVPLLIGLDLLDKYGIFINTITNRLHCPQLQLQTPLVRKNGHVYLEWPKHQRVFFTIPELLRLHRGFSHPATDKLFNLLRMARPYETNQETKHVLDKIKQACDTCQRLGPTPIRFKASIPTEDSVKFGEELSMDLMFLDGKALLHIVDTATRFSAATFLDGDFDQSVEGIWLAFIQAWCTLYTGYPNRLRVDQGSSFTSDRWRQLTDHAGIQLRISGVKAHSSLGIGERLHEPLRRIYRKVRADYPQAPNKILLSIAVKAMNDTIGEKGLVPSLLTFGITPRFPIISTELPTQDERMGLLTSGQMEMNAIIAERRIQAALTKQIPPAADRTYRLGDEVLVFCEQDKTWIGPFTVMHVQGRMITIQNREGTYRQMFNAFQLKPYYRDHSPIIHFQTRTFRSPLAPKTPFSSFLTETIKPNDPRARQFATAKKKEIDGLIRRKTWKIVAKEEVPRNANILGGRFVLTIKDSGTSKETYKARYVVQGYADKLKSSLVHDNPTARQFSVKILVGLAAVYGFRLFSTDVTQAYLQSTEKLMRDVYIKPSPEFKLSPNQLLKLLKPLYGLADSGDYWGRTLRKHLLNDIGMSASTTDGALFFKKIANQLAGLCATHVDDCLHAGNEKYLQISESIERKFQCRDREFDKIQFSGVNIETYNDGFCIHQERYIHTIETLPKDVNFAHYSSLRAKLMWLIQTRPDIACAVAQSTQVTETRFNVDPHTHRKLLNSVVRHLHKTSEQRLMYPKLDKESLRLQTYSDASYSNNYDGTSQLGYIIFLADKDDNCHPLYWSSHKSKRVSRSVLGSETMAFADAFDMTYAIKRDIELMTNQPIPISMLTDSLSLFDVITKSTITTEKRLMIDLKVVKDSYHRNELRNIGFIRSENNPADALTKVKKCPVLDQVLADSALHHRIEQWIDKS